MKKDSTTNGKEMEWEPCENSQCDTNVKGSLYCVNCQEDIDTGVADWLDPKCTKDNLCGECEECKLLNKIFPPNGKEMMERIRNFNKRKRLVDILVDQEIVDSFFQIHEFCEQQQKKIEAYKDIIDQCDVQIEHAHKDCRIMQERIVLMNQMKDPKRHTSLRVLLNWLDNFLEGNDKALSQISQDYSPKIND